MHKPKGSTTDLLKKISVAAENIKQSISKHSYLLATPENWSSLEDSSHERVSETKTQSASEKGTFLSRSSLGNSNRTQSEAAPHQKRCRKPSKRIHDYSTEERSLVKTAGDPRDDLQLEEHIQREKGGPRPLSINAPKLHTLLEDDDVELRPSGDMETTSSSPEWTTNVSGDISVVTENSTTSRVEDIASAASLVSFASLLIETLARLDHVVEAVQRLSQSSSFRVCTCSPSRVHRVEEHRTSVCDDECRNGYVRMEKGLSRSSKLSQNSKSSRHLPTNTLTQGAAD